VQRFYARAGKCLLACLILFGFAAIASLGTSLGTTLALSGALLRSAPSTPSEIVAARFPSADASLPVVPAPFATASVLPMERWELFSPAPFSLASAYASPIADGFPEPTGLEQARPVTVQTITLPATTSPQATTTKAEPPKAPATNQTATAAARRVANRPSNVLNDAQIANIKRRLNLTPDQEQMWPAVETALRKIVYTKNSAEAKVHAAPSSDTRTAYVDPTSEEVQQLKYAALPLIMRLNDDQRREVKMMAHVMGLEAVASQF
jgi:hypothetical protein